MHFNYLSGGGEYGIGVVSPTPDQIDYLLGQLTGGVGREVGKVLTTGETMATERICRRTKSRWLAASTAIRPGKAQRQASSMGRWKTCRAQGTLDRMKDARDTWRLIESTPKSIQRAGSMTARTRFSVNSPAFAN